MARYTGPKVKKARQIGEPIFGHNKYFERKKYPPGMHGKSKKRKYSDYGLQLREKQKVKLIYGVLERQFKRYFEEASRRKGNTGEILIQLLESRLDNVVYRLGLAKTRMAARQLVTHRHILVDGKICNIPSTILKPGAIISVKEKSKNLKVIQESLTASKRNKYPWLEWDSKTMTGKFLCIPDRKLIPENINEQLIVEFYSK